MPHAFTEDDKQTIRAKLLHSGRDLFVRRGLRKTTILDLAASAGIAKATFYRFFGSKGALLAELVGDEIDVILRRSVAGLSDTTDAMQQTLICLMKRLIEEIERSPLARRVLAEPSLFTREIQPYWEQKPQDGTLPFLEPLLGFFKQAQTRGDLVSGDPAAFASCLLLVAFLPLAKGRIECAQYESMITFAPVVMAHGMLRPQQLGKRRPESGASAQTGTGQ